jgi:hypothetical protein
MSFQAVSGKTIARSVLYYGKISSCAYKGVAMSNRLTLIIVLLILILIGAGFGFTRQQALSSVAASGSISEEALRAEQTRTYDVSDEAPEPSDADESARREAKNRFYNRGGADLTKMSPDLQIFETGCGPLEPLLPTAYTPVILIGTVTRLQSFLSQDKSSIYTEYAIHVEKYLKKDTDVLPTVDGSLIVDRPGGVLRLRNGQVLHYHSSGTGMARPLRVGERLVLFLMRIYEGTVLRLGRGFLLQDGKAYALWQSEGEMPLIGEIPKVDKKLSQEGEFLKALRRAIRNPPSPAFYSEVESHRSETSNQ